MESKRRTRWSAAQAKVALDDQERSGLTIQAFCQEPDWHPHASTAGDVDVTVG